MEFLCGIFLVLLKGLCCSRECPNGLWSLKLVHTVPSWYLLHHFRDSLFSHSRMQTIPCLSHSWNFKFRFLKIMFLNISTSNSHKMMHFTRRKAGNEFIRQGIWCSIPFWSYSIPAHWAVSLWTLDFSGHSRKCPKGLRSLQLVHTVPLWYLLYHFGDSLFGHSRMPTISGLTFDYIILLTYYGLDILHKLCVIIL